MRVVEVGPGVTVDDMIATMAVDKLKAEWFEALNNIKPGDSLTPGTKIKVVK